MRRWGWWILAALFCLVCLAPAVSRAADEADGASSSVEPSKSDALYTEGIKETVERGLRFLGEQQNNDGSWGSQFQVANTALAGLAILGNGNTTTRGEYAKHLRKAVNYLLTQQNENGYYRGNDQQSRMHGHGYATMFLAQVYGMSHSGSPSKPDELTVRIKDSLDRAIDVMVHSQATEGGFPYEPTQNRGNNHEGSITVCCVEGMRAARDAGIQVPKRNIDEAVDYMKKTYGGGSFAYRLGMPPNGSFALSAAGVCVLIATGDPTDSVQRMVDECLNYMWHFEPGAGSYQAYYFYSYFYAAQAFHFRGGRDWTKWYRAMARELMSSQVLENNNRIGYWRSPASEAGGELCFATSMALLILEMPNEYLPIFQR